MNAPIRVLVMEDDPEVRAFVRWELERHLGEVDILEISSEEQLVEAMKEGADVVLTERVLAWTDGLEVLDEVRRLRPGTPVIMHTGTIDGAFSVGAMRRGLDDIVQKSPPEGTSRLGPAVREILDRAIDRLASAAAEQRYRALFERVPVGLYRYDPAGTLIECNQALLDILRAADIDEVRRHGFPRSTYVDPADRAAWRAAIWQNEHVVGFEYRIRRLSGDVAWIRHSARLVRDDTGEPMWFEGVIEDVTRSREARREMEEAEARFRALVEHSSDLIFVLQEGGDIEYASPSITRSLGYEPADLVGTQLAELVHPDDRRELTGRLAMTRQGAGRATVSIRLRHHDGTWRDFEGVLTNRVADPAIHGLILNARDVTERAGVERALRDGEERYRSLVELSPDGIVVVRDGRMIFANSAMLQLLGAAVPQEVVGKEVLDFVHPDYRDLVRARLRQQQEEGKPAPLIQERLIRVDGSEVDVEVSGVPVVYEGAAASQAVLRDVSDRGRFESESEDRTRRQAAIAELGRAALREGPLSTILEIACRCVAGALGTEIVSVLELLPGQETLLLRAGVGWPAGIVGTTRVARGGSAAGLTADAAGPIVVQDLATEKRFTPHPVMVAAGIVSMALVAIHGKDELYGVLSASSREPRAFTPDDLSFLSALANTLGEVIQRKRAEDDLRRTLRQLRELNEERQRLLGRLVVAQEEERQRIAGDIHDDPIQVMAAAAVRLDMVERAVLGTSEQQTVDKAADTVQQAIGRLRHLVFELRPPALDREGLVVAIRQYLDRLVEDTGVDAGLHADLDEEPARETRTALYRIVQEALTNVRKHAEARTIEVTLARQEGGVLARVRDDGAGFVPKAEAGRSRPGHLGLQSMRERAEALGGWWRVESYPGHGATVEFWLPDVADRRGEDE